MDKYTDIFTAYATFIYRVMLSLGIILAVAICLIYLFRKNRGKMILAQLVRADTGEKAEINSWEVSIGRAKTSDIVIENETVSRFHAVIARRGKGWIIFDTHSKAGVTVNGNKIDKKAYIFDGDILTFGSCVMTFRSPLFRRENAKKSQKAVRTELHSENIPAKKTDIRKAVTASKKSIPSLVNLSDSSMILLFADEYIIGRDSSCDIIIPILTVSKFHAKLKHSEKGWTLEDLDSRTGTSVNGVRIKEPYTMSDDDVINVGGIIYRFVENYMDE